MIVEEDFLTVEETMKFEDKNREAARLFEIIESMESSVHQAKYDLDQAEAKYEIALKIARRIINEEEK